MSRHKRVTLSMMMVLFLTAALVAPGFAQTGPYQPEEAPPEEEPPAEEAPREEAPPEEAPPEEQPPEEAPLEEPEVEGVVIEAPEEPEIEDEAVEEELAEVRGVTLARTGSDTLLLLVAGLLVLGLGVLTVLRSRRRDAPDA